MAVPTDVSGLVFWLKADSLSLSDGQDVTTWQDSSATGRDVTQGTAGNRPTYIASGLNGLPVVRFAYGDTLAATSNVSDGSGEFTVMTVFKQTTSTNGWVVHNGTAGNGFALGLSSSGSGRELLLGGVADIVGDDTTLGQAEILSAERFGSLSRLQANGVRKQVSSTGYASAGAGITIGGLTGGGSNFVGDVCEVLIWSRALEESEQYSMRAYLSGRWGVSTAAIVLSDDTTFTGSNGDSWPSNWREWRNAGSGTASIQSNRGYQYAGSQSGYSASQTMQAIDAGIVGDGEVTGTVTFNVDNETFAQDWFRVKNPAQDGYFLSIEPTYNFVRLMKRVNWTQTPLGTGTTVTISASTTYGYRVQFTGTSLRYRFWDTAGSEPSTWLEELTDSSHVRGYYAQQCDGGSATGQTWSVNWDSISLHVQDAPTASPALMKVWDGSQWRNVSFKIWDGSQWVRKTAKYWDGTQWVDITDQADASSVITFTGSNGDPWPSELVAGTTATGSTATIQSNMGRMVTGTTNGPMGTPAISRRTTNSVADSVLTGTFKYTSTTAFIHAYLRAGTDCSTTGYILAIAPQFNDWTFFKRVSGTQTQIGSGISLTGAANTLFKFKFEVVGTTVRAKVWLATDSEPASWGQSVTDSSLSTGFAGVAVEGASKTVDWDDIEVV